MLEESGRLVANDICHARSDLASLGHRDLYRAVFTNGVVSTVIQPFRDLAPGMKVYIMDDREFRSKIGSQHFLAP